MPFLIVDETEYQKELEKLESHNEPTNGNEVLHENTLVVTEIEKGRKEGTKEIPQELREIIAEEKLLGTPSAIIQKHFNVSPASIAAYSHGATSTASYNKPTDKLTQVRNRVSSRAANRLNEALRALGNKDLSQEAAKDISTIAKDMATVFEKISPVKQQEDADANKHLHLHMYVPKMKTIDDYETIDINVSK